MAGLNKKNVTIAKISPKMLNPRDLTGNAEEEEEEYDITMAEDS